MSNEKKLCRSNDKKICGVCAGLGEYFNIDPTLVRIGYALFSLFTAGLTGVIVYAILAVVMPEKSSFESSVNTDSSANHSENSVAESATNSEQ